MNFNFFWFCCFNKRPIIICSFHDLFKTLESYIK
uniref:Uncharacterized protein n=1 Tax=Siphoviridae sp. ctkzC12 TaxID=2826446 RepID=A0A8S5LVU0_9CAUD|nr:MAG TPA: hypothetical protein [Siphoviridae sp. ctkzC12]